MSCIATTYVACRISTARAGAPRKAMNYRPTTFTRGRIGDDTPGTQRVVVRIVNSAAREVSRTSTAFTHSGANS